MGLLGLLLLFCLLCIVSNGTQLHYANSLDTALPRYDYKTWPSYIVAILSIVTVVLQAASVIRQIAENAPPPQSEKRKKIRHCDV